MLHRDGHCELTVRLHVSFFQARYGDQFCAVPSVTCDLSFATTSMAQVKTTVRVSPINCTRGIVLLHPEFACGLVDDAASLFFKQS